MSPSIQETSPKVVTLGGHKAYLPGEPVKEIVDLLEKALEQARSGNMRAVALAFVLCPDTSYPIIDGDFWADACRGRDLYASIGQLTRRIERWLDQ